MAKTKQFDAETLGLTQNPKQHMPCIHTDEVDLPSLAKLKAEVVSDTQVALDHARAVAYIDLPIFPGERDVTDSHAQMLYDEMRKGTFNPLLVILSSALLRGVRYKINGQHTCWAVLAMPASFSITVREIEYRVTSEEQLKLLYSTYDRLRARSDTHITKIFLADTALTKDLWMSEVPRLVNAFRLWHVVEDNQRRRVTPEQLAAVIQREFSDVFRQVSLYRQTNAPNPLVKRQAVIAAMLATFHKVPTKAAEFWQPVLDGVNLGAKSDPRWQLRDMLLRSTIRSSTVSTTKNTRIMSVEDMYRCCLSAWNKWRKGESMATLRMLQERPKVQ